MKDKSVQTFVFFSKQTNQKLSKPRKIETLNNETARSMGFKGLFSNAKIIRQF